MVCVFGSPPASPAESVWFHLRGSWGSCPAAPPKLALVGCFGETCNLREAAPKKTSAGKTLDSSTNTIPTREEEEEEEEDEEEEGTIAVIRLQALITSILSLSLPRCALVSILFLLLVGVWKRQSVFLDLLWRRKIALDVNMDRCLDDEWGRLYYYKSI